MKYYVETENKRGNTVSAGNHNAAKATLGVLKPGVTKFNSSAGVLSQANQIVVALERDEDGVLVLDLDLGFCKEDVKIMVQQNGNSPRKLLETRLAGE